MNRTFLIHIYGQVAGTHIRTLQGLGQVTGMHIQVGCRFHTYDIHASARLIALADNELRKSGGIRSVLLLLLELLVIIGG